MTTASLDTIPAFKEWNGICAALEQGAQTIILRKGGISEDSGAFAFEHHEFVLFPTAYHQQKDKTHLPETVSIPSLTPGTLSIRSKCRIEHKAVLRDWAKVQALAPFHFWTEEVIQDRFNYDEVGAIHLAIVRVFQFQPAVQLPDSPDYGGCKSWVRVPTPTSSSVPVLTDEAFAKVKAAILKTLE